MASRVPTSKMTLPSIRTIFPPSTFSSPSYSPSSDDEMPFMPLTQKTALTHDAVYRAPYLPLPLPMPRHANHNRRVSNFSDRSMPSLTHSPSPSPSPSPSCSSQQRVRLVPCALTAADVVVVATNPPSSGTSSSRTGATLLTGPAIVRAAKDNRKMHPYRVVRENRT